MRSIRSHWSIAVAASWLMAAGCGSDVTTPPTGAAGGNGGAGGVYVPSPCMGLDHDACCAENVNGCLWMWFEVEQGTLGRGECGERDLCRHDEDCPDGFRCRYRLIDGVCGDPDSVPVAVCYSPDKWYCPYASGGACTYIGD